MPPIAVAFRPHFGSADASSAQSAALREATLELIATGDAGDIAARLLAAAQRVLVADTASIWTSDGERQICRGAVGEGRERLTGMSVDSAELEATLPREADVEVALVQLMVEGRCTAVLRVTRSLNALPPFGLAERIALRHLADVAGVVMSAATRAASVRQRADDRELDVGLIANASREIASTLDPDRIVRLAVNLASTLLTVDRCVIALRHKGKWRIHSVAGAEVVDAKDPALCRLAARAEWAASRGETFSVPDRTEPTTDAELAFTRNFDADLSRDDVISALYVPLECNGAIAGSLILEANRASLATPRERQLAELLAKQTSVSLANARRYGQIPFAATIGAMSRRIRAYLDLPARSRATYSALALLTLAALTLVRWPLRVSGTDARFRAVARAEIRPLVSGMVDRVFVREGMAVERGAPIAHLRDDERRARRDASVAAVAAAERSAAIAAARGDAAEERLERLRIDVLRSEAALLDEQIASSTIRSPVRGIVLTERPDERISSLVEAGDLLVVVGRTDSLELELHVDQRDVTRVHAGDEVRLRVTALPQRTFSGRVLTVALLASSSDERVSFPVRAMVANSDGLLRPGMDAYARVLTAPASMLGRITRQPLRSARLLWWRIWS